MGNIQRWDNYHDDRVATIFPMNFASSAKVEPEDAEEPEVVETKVIRGGKQRFAAQASQAAETK